MPVKAENITIGTGDHVVQFYEHDTDLIKTVGAYLLDAVRAGEVAIMVATEDHRRGFETELESAGIDLAAARACGTLIAVDAADTMARFVTDDRPDPKRFSSVIGGLLRQASEGGRRVRAYGEMVALLWDAGNVTAAIELEDLWNRLGREVAFSLFCAYPTQSVSGAERSHALREVCRLHSAIVPSHAVDCLDAAGRLADWTEDARHFPVAPDSPGSARGFVVEALRQRGHEGTCLDDAALVVTELATNAVVHAQSPFTVAVSAHGHAVRVSVHDACPVPPVRRHGGPLTQSGRGLGLVSAFASRWGTELMSDGKVVWAELR